jgi:hypothetical protein
MFNFFSNLFKKSGPELSEEQKSAAFQAKIKAQINEVRRLQENGTDAVECQKLIDRFQAAGTFDLANLLLRSLINNTQAVTDEKQRERDHKKMLEYAKEIEQFNTKGLIDGDIGAAFLNLAQQQFRNEMLRIAKKVNPT